MGVYQIETDHGTFEVTTDEPSETHPHLPDIGKSVDMVSPKSVTTNAAERLVSAIQPEVQGPPQGNEGFLSRLAKATRQTFFPTSIAEAKSILNPNLGQYGVPKVLEEEGKRVGSAIRNIGDTTANYYADTLGRTHPYAAAAIGTGVSVPLEAVSDSLTPSAMQQQIGAEGAARFIPGVLRKGLTDLQGGLAKGSELLTGTKSINFKRVGEDPSIFTGYMTPEALGGDMSAKTAGARLGAAEKVFEGAQFSPEGRLEPLTTPKAPPSPTGTIPVSEKVQKAALSAFPDRGSLPLASDASLTQNQDFIKAKFDAADVVNKYAEKRGVEATPEFAKQLHQDMHDAAHSITFGKTPEERLAIANKVKADFPGIDKDWLALNRKVQIDNQPGYFESLQRVKAKAPPPNPLKEFVSQDNPFKSNQETASKYFNMAREGQKFTPKQMLEAYQAAQDYLQTVPRQDRRFVDMLNFKNKLQETLMSLSPEYAGAVKDFQRAATGRATTNVLPRTQTGKVSQGRVGFNALLTGGAALGGPAAALAAFGASSPVVHGAAHAGYGILTKTLTNPVVARTGFQAILARARARQKK